MKISNVVLIAVCLIHLGAECEATLCVEDYHVVNNICVVCPSGQSNLAGDDPTGQDTSCDGFKKGDTCSVALQRSMEGDDASGSDTTCDVLLCAANEYVSNNACVACAAGTTNDASDDASGSDTTCDVTLCGAVCVVCVVCFQGTVSGFGSFQFRHR